MDLCPIWIVEILILCFCFLLVLWGPIFKHQKLCGQSIECISYTKEMQSSPPTCCDCLREELAEEKPVRNFALKIVNLDFFFFLLLLLTCCFASFGRPSWIRAKRHKTISRRYPCDGRVMFFFRRSCQYNLGGNGCHTSGCIVKPLNVLLIWIHFNIWCHSQ